MAVHRSTSADTGLSQQLCMLRMREATQKTSVGRRRPMQNHESLNAPLGYHTTYHWFCINSIQALSSTLFKLGDS